MTLHGDAKKRGQRKQDATEQTGPGQYEMVEEAGGLEVRERGGSCQ